MTKKLMRIEFPDELKSAYSDKINSGVVFGLVGKKLRNKDDFKIRTQLTSFHSCRERVTSNARSYINKYSFSGNLKSLFEKYELDLTKARILIATETGDKSQKDYIFAAKKVINIFEKEAGWIKSVITTTKHNDITEGQVWLLTGSKNWITTPQMLSLICLIFRIGVTFKCFNKVETIKDLNDVFKSLAKNSDEEYNDKRFIGPMRKHIVNLMKNFSKVFTGDLKQYYPPATEQDKDALPFNGYGGIDTLMKCATGNKELEDRLKKYVFNIN